MGLLTRLFGGKIDPDAVAPGPFAAMPYMFGRMGRTVYLRVFYSPSPKFSFDVPALHQTIRRCREAQDDPRPGRDMFWQEPFHRFIPLCRKFPAAYSGPVPVWVRDFFFRASDLPPDFEENNGYPLWLADDGRAEGRFAEKPGETPATRAQQRLAFARRRNARTVRAVLIQANAMLFEPGTNDLPCLALFSFDDRIDDEELRELAHRVFELKGTHSNDPDHEMIAGLTTDERFTYYRRVRLPRSFTDGKEAFVADLYVHRPFLEEGYFHGERMMMCLAEPGERGALELLPFGFDE